MKPPLDTVTVFEMAGHLTSVLQADPEAGSWDRYQLFVALVTALAAVCMTDPKPGRGLALAHEGLDVTVALLRRASQ